MGIADYPYDPIARVERLEGLEKLRAVRDRELAQQLYRLYLHIEQADASGLTHHWKTAEAKEREEAEMRDLQAVAKAAFDGAYGVEGKALAAQMLVDDQTWGRPKRTDRPSLLAFRDSLRELRHA